MLFSSLVFLWYFLPAVFLLYFITKNLHIRNGVLLAASLFFYAWGEPKYVILMLVSIGLNYFFGLWIGRMQSKHRMRLAVTTCVFLNLLLLGYFKYFNFAVEIANSLLSRFAGGAHTLSFREIDAFRSACFYGAGGDRNILLHVSGAFLRGGCVPGDDSGAEKYLSSGALYFFLSAAHRGTDRQVSRCLRTDWKPAVYGGGDGVWNQALFLRTGEKNVVC